MTGEWISRWDNESTEDVIYENGDFVMRVPPGQGTCIVLCHNAALRKAVEDERRLIAEYVEQMASCKADSDCLSDLIRGSTHHKEAARDTG